MAFDVESFHLLVGDPFTFLVDLSRLYFSVGTCYDYGKGNRCPLPEARSQSLASGCRLHSELKGPCAWRQYLRNLNSKEYFQLCFQVILPSGGRRRGYSLVEGGSLLEYRYHGRTGGIVGVLGRRRDFEEVLIEMALRL